MSNVPTREALLADLEEGFSQGGIRHRKRARYRRSLSWGIVTWTARVLRRTVDALIAALLIVIFSPLLLLLIVIAKIARGEIRERVRLGRWGIHFSQYELYFPESSIVAGLNVFCQLPSLYNVLKGEMSFIGPRPIAPDEIFSDERAAWKRYNLRPGMLGLWWLRKRANIAYASEVGLDLEYVENNSLWGDLGIVLRAVPTAFWGGSVGFAPSKLRFLGVSIDNLTMAEAASRMMTMVKTGSMAQVCFVNADCVNIAYNDSQYRETLANSQLVLADGIGVRIAGAILNQNVRENVNGTDMLPFLCEAAEREGRSLYLLGGQLGAAEGTASWIGEHYPHLKIAGCQHGYFSEDEENGVVQTIQASGADILLVALGAPRQEKWIAANGARLGVKISIGVGGLLDFYSGRIRRAPLWVRELGLEWLYRFWQEPRRMWRRYVLGNIIFLLRLADERIHTRVSARTGDVAQ